MFAIDFRPVTTRVATNQNDLVSWAMKSVIARIDGDMEEMTHTYEYSSLHASPENAISFDAIN
jgi:hypothetical protein